MGQHGQFDGGSDARARALRSLAWQTGGAARCATHTILGLRHMIPLAPQRRLQTALDATSCGGTWKRSRQGRDGPGQGIVPASLTVIDCSNDYRCVSSTPAPTRTLRTRAKHGPRITAGSNSQGPVNFALTGALIRPDPMNFRQNAALNGIEIPRIAVIVLSYARACNKKGSTDSACRAYWRPRNVRSRWPASPSVGRRKSCVIVDPEV